MPIWDFDGTVSHEGLVIREYENNGYNDSDFYAVVWNEAEGKPQSIMFMTTRAGCGRANAAVDATPEVMAAYRRWEAASAAYQRFEHACRSSVDPTPGKVVRVVDGRGPKGHSGRWQGTIGRVFWRGANGFGTYYRNGYNRPEQAHNQRVGIQLPDGSKAFTALLNVQVVPDEALRA